MLSVVSPGSYVLGAIAPDEGAFSILLAILEVSFIASSIIPKFDSSTLNRTQAEFSFIDFVYICKIVLALSLELAINEFSFIVATIGPFELASSLLLTFVEHAHISSPSAIITPDFFSEAMLGIVDPLSVIPDTLSSIKEDPLPHCLIRLPLTNVHILVGLGHLASALKETILELALISCSILIQLYTQSILLVRLKRPLTLVLNPRVILVYLKLINVDSSHTIPCQVPQFTLNLLLILLWIR